MGLFDRIFGNAPPRAALPKNAVTFANDLVLAALIAPDGHPIEGLIARAVQGEVTPIICDSTLYWIMCSVQENDTVRADRFAELLRFAHVLVTERSERGFTKPSQDEIDHWRSVVFGTDSQADEVGPSMLCSQCLEVCSGPDAHVIPWWNSAEADFFTTFRCSKCWLGSLDETRDRAQRLDDDVRQKFCAFLERHNQQELALKIARLTLDEASVLITDFIEKIRSKSVVLKT